jgi:hypothetical protein
MNYRLAAIIVLLGCGLVFVHGLGAHRGDRSVSSEAPVSSQAVAAGRSPAVSSFASPARPGADRAMVRVHEAGRPDPAADRSISPMDKDGARAAFSSTTTMPSPSLSFDGLTNFDNILAYNLLIIPPDTIGDVGPAHYVQAVNALVRVFDKNGNALTPPFRMSQVFASLGTACSSRNDGEPVVLYDSLADRWLLSQYCNNFPPFRQLIAISVTGDPTGSYYTYEFVMPNIRLNDFAKFGVWPDAYYMSTEEFTGGDFSGTGAFAFERAKMLAGDPTASYIYFHRPSIGNARQGNLLPADLDGLRPPPAGAPNVFAGYSANEYGEAADALRLFDFHPDFANAANSTFVERPESPLAVAAFDPTSLEGRADITQPPPGERLDANSDRLNYRAAYRNHGNAESLVLTQTVALSTDPYRAGTRIYELRRTSGAFSVVEQATIGDASASRWIASAAVDHLGNLAVGYNFVSDQKQPSLLYTGRLASDPGGTFRKEATLIDGTGVQRAFGFRWGDYSGMSVDPVDDCTFWMTGEYYTLASQQFSEFTWLTRIGRFKFDECTPAPRSIITGVVTNSLGGQPIEGARVTASAYSRATNAGGSYGELAVVPGSYQVTASAHGYRSQTATVTAADGQNITLNFALEPVAVLAETSVALVAESCPANGSPDPGERVSVTLALGNTGSLPTQSLVATLLPEGGVHDPGPAQVYGVLYPDSPPVARTFSLAVDAGVTCGRAIKLTFRLQDGSTQLGEITVAMPTGKPRVALRESFDRTLSGGLPSRWSRSETRLDPMQAVGERQWRVSAARSFSASRSVHAVDPHYRGLNELLSPVVRINSPEARLTFRHLYKLESTFLLNRLYDGTVLEISLDGGEWRDILTAGGTFESGGYNGLIDACCQNPLANRPGWAGRSGINETAEWVSTSVRLPASAAGRNIRLRWRLATDIGNSVFVEGHFIDDVLITDGSVCGC